MGGSRFNSRMLNTSSARSAVPANRSESADPKDPRDPAQRSHRLAGVGRLPPLRRGITSQFSGQRHEGMHAAQRVEDERKLGFHTRPVNLGVEGPCIAKQIDQRDQANETVGDGSSMWCTRCRYDAQISIYRQITSGRNKGGTSDTYFTRRCARPERDWSDGLPEG